MQRKNRKNLLKGPNRESHLYNTSILIGHFVLSSKENKERVEEKQKNHGGP